MIVAVLNLLSRAAFALARGLDRISHPIIMKLESWGRRWRRCQWCGLTPNVPNPDCPRPPEPEEEFPF